MLVYGKNVAKEYLLNKHKIKKIYLSDKFDDKDILALIHNKNVKYQLLKKYEMDKRFPKVNQGIVLDVLEYEFKTIDSLDQAQFIVMLDHIEDPHNFGAIIRTCEAAGVDGIIIPKDRSVGVNATVIKTSVGTTDNMNIVQVTNLANTIDQLKKDGFWIIGTDMEGTDYTQIDYDGKICIICGNEGRGISNIIHKKCDFIASIPMKGKVNSLNASVATGIVLFEALKKRGI